MEVILGDVAVFLAFLDRFERITPGGIKTRRFDNIVDELEQSFTLHTELGSRLGGVHIELTGDDVTECVGGQSGVLEDGLLARYETACDPRLNRVQALELSFLVADMLLDK
mgnify:CR=1 FL=1